MDRLDSVRPNLIMLQLDHRLSKPVMIVRAYQTSFSKTSCLIFELESFLRQRPLRDLPLQSLIKVHYYNGELFLYSISYTVNVEPPPEEDCSASLSS